MIYLGFFRRIQSIGKYNSNNEKNYYVCQKHKITIVYNITAVLEPKFVMNFKKAITDVAAHTYSSTFIVI